MIKTYRRSLGFFSFVMHVNTFISLTYVKSFLISYPALLPYKMARLPTANVGKPGKTKPFKSMYLTTPQLANRLNIAVFNAVFNNVLSRSVTMVSSIETSWHDALYRSKAEKNENFNKAFLDETVETFFEKEAPGKRVLDIGCGSGVWCSLAARYGAKSVDGFDKEEGMVELAKKTTAQYNTVSIQLGDIMNMPYADNTFDVALSMYVTCELPIEILSKHFTELHRVLAPGGKALVLNLSNPIYQETYLTDGANKAVVQKKTDDIVACLPSHPSHQQLNEAFADLHEVVSMCFAYNKNDSLFHVKNVDQLVNGQTVLIKTCVIIFPDVYYDDQFLVDQTKAAGLHIDRIENTFTEERRTLHNILNPQATLSKDVVDHPFHLFYHITKPT